MLKSAVTTILLSKTYQNWFLYYHLPCSLKIFRNVFAFLYVKVNSTEISEEMSSPFTKKMLMSAFLFKIQG